MIKKFGLWAVLSMWLLWTASCTKQQGIVLHCEVSEIDSAGYVCTLMSPFAVAEWGDSPTLSLLFVPDTLERDLVLPDSARALWLTDPEGQLYLPIPLSDKKNQRISVYLEPHSPSLSYIAEDRRSGSYIRFAKEHTALLRRWDRIRLRGPVDSIDIVRQQYSEAVAKFLVVNRPKKELDPRLFAFLSSEKELEEFLNQVEKESRGKYHVEREQLPLLWQSKPQMVFSPDLLTRSWHAYGKKDTLNWTPQNYPVGYCVFLDQGHYAQISPRASVVPYKSDTLCWIVPIGGSLPYAYVDSLPARCYFLDGSYARRIQLAYKLQAPQATLPLPNGVLYQWDSLKQDFIIKKWHSVKLPQAKTPVSITIPSHVSKDLFRRDTGH